jgi:hypothetical protein
MHWLGLLILTCLLLVQKWLVGLDILLTLREYLLLLGQQITWQPRADLLYSSAGVPEAQCIVSSG